MAFDHLGVELEFSGSVGVDEVAKVNKFINPIYQIEAGKEVLAIDPKYFRPAEINLLKGDLQPKRK
jgi:GDPmannose 4,6-dehydratase